VKIRAASDLGEIKSAFLVDNTVYLARHQAIQRVRLSDGRSDVLIDFGFQITGRAFYLTPDRSNLLYAMRVQDPGSAYGQGIRAGFIALASGVVRPFLSSPQNIIPLGLSSDGQTLFGMPVGDDSDFGPLWLIDTRDGSIRKEVAMIASGSASLSPDQRYVATRYLWVKDSMGHHAENVVRLYNLSTANAAPFDFIVPPQPSTFGGFLWTSDSRTVYIQPKDVNDDQPFGIWRLGIPSGVMDRVAYISDPMLGIVSISPDGKWLLMQRGNQDGGILLGIANGQAYSFPLPVLACLAGWQ
jgi:hypothetical protein